MIWDPKLSYLYNHLGYVYYKIGGKENYDKAMELGGKDGKPYWKYNEAIIGKK